MESYDICFVPEGSNMGRNLQRVVARDEVTAVDTYKDVHLKDNTEPGTVKARRINDIRLKHEEKARVLLYLARQRGYSRWIITDEEGEIQLFDLTQEQAAIRALMATDMQTLEVCTRGFTEAEVTRIKFLLLWDNEEVIADHTDNPEAEAIANAFLTRFGL